MASVLDYSLTLVTGPTSEPVTLVEAKKHCEIATSDTTHDTQLRSLIAAARKTVETHSRLRLCCQTWDMKLDAWPGADKILLRVGPVLSITHVKYVDTDGNTQTWNSANYEADIVRSRPCIWRAYGVDWPSGSTRSIQNCVTVRAVCGFGDEFTVSTTNDTLTPAKHTYADQALIQLSNYDGALPAGLATNTTYYVEAPTSTTIQVETSVDGGAVDITGEGTGTHVIDQPPEEAKQAILLLVSHWFESREPVVVGSVASPIDMTYRALIDAIRPGYYP